MTTTRAPPVSEAAWQQTVTAMLDLYGYRTYHTRDSRGSAPGFPDLVAVHPGQRRCLFIETKTATGRLTEDQEIWLAALQDAGEETFVWRPADWDRACTIARGEP